jgi:hypothetical protein
MSKPKLPKRSIHGCYRAKRLFLIAAQRTPVVQTPAPKYIRVLLTLSYTIGLKNCIY